jgi:hypothetical protein
MHLIFSFACVCVGMCVCRWRSKLELDFERGYLNKGRRQQPASQAGAFLFCSLLFYYILHSDSQASLCVSVCAREPARA